MGLVIRAESQQRAKKYSADDKKNWQQRQKRSFH